MGVADSARKHGISDEDILHGVRHAMREVPTGQADRIFLIGPDTRGGLLELIVLDPEDDPVVIHADVLRPKFYEFLQGGE